jgi:phage tail tube protein FII
MTQSIFELVHWNAKFISSDTTPTTVKPSGIITDLTLPTLTREMDDTVRAGELGVVSRPKKFGELAVSFNVKSYDEDLYEILLTGMSQYLTMEATTCMSTDAGVVTTYKVECKGFVNELPLGELSEDGFESEVSMMCYYLKTTFGSKVSIYDPRNYVLSIDGTNLFSGIANILDPPPPQS